MVLTAICHATKSTNATKTNARDTTIIGEGEVAASTNYRDNPCRYVFDDFPNSLISVGRLADDDTISIFTKDSVSVHQEQDVLLISPVVENPS